MTKYGYCRVANNSEGSLEIQKAMMQKEMCDEILAEVHSGIKVPSDALEDLFNRLEKGDTLVISAIDRISRNPNIVNIVLMTLLAKGVEVKVLETGTVAYENSINNFHNALNSMLEMQRSYLSERIKEGKRIAKQREGYVEGRPKTYTPEQLEHAMKLLETKTYDEVAAETKISRSTLIREKSKRKNLHNN